MIKIFNAGLPKSAEYLEYTTIFWIIALAIFSFVNSDNVIATVSSEFVFLVLVLGVTRLRFNWLQIVLSIIMGAVILYTLYDIIIAVFDYNLDLLLAWDVCSIILFAYQLYLLWRPSMTKWLLLKN